MEDRVIFMCLSSLWKVVGCSCASHLLVSDVLQVSVRFFHQQETHIVKIKKAKTSHSFHGLLLEGPCS